jgi:aspartate/methionine/tyrosine aminotransferase
MALVEQQTKLTSTEFCERVLDEQRLFLIPGRPLGISDRLLRFGLGMSDFSQGLERLGQFLTKLEESDEAS